LSAVLQQILAQSNGIVTVLMMYDRYNEANAEATMSLQKDWAALHNISINYIVFSQDKDYATYTSQVKTACLLREAGLFDIIWVDAVSTGYLADCLLDFFSLDSTIGSSYIPALLKNGIVKNRLVTLPYEADISVLYYNEDLLNKYSFSQGPVNMDDMESMLTSILENERTFENFLLSGYTGPFSASEDFFGVVMDWIGGVNGTVITSDAKNVTILSKAVANAVQNIVGWTSSGLLDPNDLSFSELDAVNRFLSEKAVFVRGTGSTASLLAHASFSWGTSFIPGTTISPVATIGGWNLGVYKYSKNPNWAQELARYMTSEEYQTSRFSKLSTIGALPTIHNLILNPAICAHVGQSLCSIYNQVNLITRPAAAGGNLYPQLSSIVASSVNGILTGNTFVINGLQSADSQIRNLFGIAQLNSTVDIDLDEQVGKAGKKVAKNVGIQVAVLFFVIGVTGIGIAIYKQRQLTGSSKKAQESDTFKVEQPKRDESRLFAKQVEQTNQIEMHELGEKEKLMQLVEWV